MFQAHEEAGNGRSKVPYSSFFHVKSQLFDLKFQKAAAAKERSFQKERRKRKMVHFRMVQRSYTPAEKWSSPLVTKAPLYSRHGICCVQCACLFFQLAGLSKMQQQSFLFTALATKKFFKKRDSYPRRSFGFWGHRRSWLPGTVPYQGRDLDRNQSLQPRCDIRQSYCNCKRESLG